MAAVYTVTEWRPVAGFTWKTKVAGVVVSASHSLEAADEMVTRLTLGVEWLGRGAWLARAAFSRKTRIFLEREAEAFAQIAEG